MVTFQFRSIKLQGMHGWTQTMIFFSREPCNKTLRSLAHMQLASSSPQNPFGVVPGITAQICHKKQILLLMVPTHQNIGQMRNLPQRVTIDAVMVIVVKPPLITIHFSKLSADLRSLCQGTTMARAAFCSAAFLLGHAELTTIFFS